MTLEAWAGSRPHTTRLIIQHAENFRDKLKLPTDGRYRRERLSGGLAANSQEMRLQNELFRP